MISSSSCLSEFKKNGYYNFTGTPCSYLKPFINSVIDDDELDFIETTNEGDAVALASGAYLGGIKSVVMFQNSGLGNAINPLTSLSYTMKLPFIGIVTLRGEVDGPSDEPQHELMGKITTDLLDIMEIPWAYFPTDLDKISGALFFADKICSSKKTPFFFVMRKDSVEKYELKNISNERRISHYHTVIKRDLVNKIEMTRTEALRAIKDQYLNKNPIIATTGKTGRELFEIEDTENQLYMVGSMGCTLPIALGLVKAGYKKPVCAIDGDGSLLMRLGNMALSGHLKFSNITHVLLDNGIHDSTGGQKTFSELTDFCTMAIACGYNEVFEVDNPEALKTALKISFSSEKLTFIRVLILGGSPKNLGRPTVSPSDVALRMKKFLLENM